MGVMAPCGTERVWAAVLAGGRSSRMGRDKASLEIGGRTLLGGLLEVLDRTFPRVALVMGAPREGDPAGREYLHDTVPDQGPIGGLAAALDWCGADYLFLIACDMPFPDPLLMRLMADAPDAAMVVPEAGGRLHPLHARYARSMRGRVAAAIAAGRRSMGALFDASTDVKITEAVMELHGVDPARALRNVNTPGEYADALKE